MKMSLTYVLIVVLGLSHSTFGTQGITKGRYSIMTPDKQRLVCDPENGYCMHKLYSRYLNAGTWSHIVTIDVSPPKFILFVTPCKPHRNFPEIVNKTCRQVGDMIREANHLMSQVTKQSTNFLQMATASTSVTSAGVEQELRRSKHRSRRGLTDFFGNIANFFGIASTKQIRGLKEAIHRAGSMASANRQGLRTIVRSFVSYQSSIKREFDIRDKTLSLVLNKTMALFSTVGKDIDSLGRKILKSRRDIQAAELCITILGSVLPLMISVDRQLYEALQWYITLNSGFANLMGGRLDPILLPYKVTTTMLRNIRGHLKRVNSALDIAIGPQDLKSLYSQVKCSPFVSGGHLMIFMSFEIIDKTPHSMDVWKISSFGVPIKVSPSDRSSRARLLRTEYPDKQLMVALSLPYTHIAFSTKSSVVITYSEHQIAKVRRIGSRIVLPPKAYQMLSAASACLNCLVQMCSTQQIRKICMVDIIFQESIFIQPTGPNAWLVHAKDEKVFSVCGDVSSSILKSSDVIITVPCGCYLKIGSSLTTPIAVSSHCNSGKDLTTEYIVPALLLGGTNVTLDRAVWSALAKAHPEMDLRTSDLAEQTSRLFVQVEADQHKKIQATRANQDRRWKSQLLKITESFQSSERAELEMMAFLKTIKVETVLPALIAIVILTVLSVGVLAIMIIRLYSRNQRLMASNLRPSAMGGAFIGSLSKCETAEVSREVMVWVEALNGSYPVRITRIDEGHLPDGWAHVAYYIGSAVAAGIILALLSIVVRWVIAKCQCLPITLRNPNYCSLPTSWSQVVSIFKEAGREIDIEIWKKVKHAIVVQNLWLCPIVRDACCDIRYKI